MERCQEIGWVSLTLPLSSCEEESPDSPPAAASLNGARKSLRGPLRLGDSAMHGDDSIDGKGPTVPAASEPWSNESPACSGAATACQCSSRRQVEFRSPCLKSEASKERTHALSKVWAMPGHFSQPGSSQGGKKDRRPSISLLASPFLDSPHVPLRVWMGWPTLDDALFTRAGALLSSRGPFSGGADSGGSSKAAKGKKLLENFEELRDWQKASNAADLLQAWIDEDESSKDAKGGLRKALLQAFRDELALAMVIYMLQVVCSIFMPVSAFLMLRWCEDPRAPDWEGYAIMAGMALANVLAVLLKELFTQRCSVMGEWTMSACQVSETPNPEPQTFTLDPIPYTLDPNPEP